MASKVPDSTTLASIDVTAWITLKGQKKAIADQAKDMQKQLSRSLSQGLNRSFSQSLKNVGAKASVELTNSVDKSLKSNGKKFSRSFGSTLASSFDKTFKRVGGGLTNTLSTAAKSSYTSLGRGLESTFSAAGKSFSNYIGKPMAASVATIAGLGVGAFSTGVNYNAAQQRNLVSLTTLLGSQDAALKQLNNFDVFAKASPFSKESLMNAQRQMISFGFESGEVLNILNRLQDSVATFGGGAQQLEEVASIFSKIRASQRIDQVDINMLSDRGINLPKLLAQQMKKSETEMRELLYGEPLRGEDAMNALNMVLNQMQISYGGAAEKVKETWVGATDRVKAAWRDIGAAMARDFVNPLGGGVGVDWANSFADSLREIERIVKIITGQNLLGNFYENVSRTLDGLTTKLKAIGSSQVTQGIQNLYNAFDKLKDVLVPLGIFFGLLGGSALLGSIPIIGAIFPAISPLVALLATLTIMSSRVRDAFKSAWDTIWGALRPTMPKIEKGFKTILHALEGTFVIAIQKAADLVAYFINNIDKLVPLLVIAGAAFVTVTTGINPLFLLFGLLITRSQELRDTISDSWTRIKTSIEGVLPSINTGLTGLLDKITELAIVAIPKITDGLVYFLDNFRDFIPLFVVAAAAMLSFATGFNPILSGFLALSLVSPELRETLGTVFTTLFESLKSAAPLLSTVFSAIVGAMPALMGAINPLIPLVGKLFDDLVVFATDLALRFIPVLVTAFETLSPAIGAVLQMVIDTMPMLMPVFGAIISVINQLVPVIGSAIVALIPAFSYLMQTIANLMPELVPVFSLIIAQIPRLVDAIVPLLPKLIELGALVIQFAAELATALLPKITDMAISLAPVFSDLLDFLIENWDTIKWIIVAVISLVGAFKLVGGVVRFIRPIISVIKNIITVVKNVIKFVRNIPTLFKNIWNGVKTFFTRILNFFKSIPAFFKNIWNGIKGLFTRITSFLSKIFGPIARFFGRLGGWIKNAFRPILSFLSRLAPVWGWIVRGFSAVVAAITGLGLGLGIVFGLIIGIIAFAIYKIASDWDAFVQGAKDTWWLLSTTFTLGWQMFLGWVQTAKQWVIDLFVSMYNKWKEITAIIMTPITWLIAGIKVARTWWDSFVNWVIEKWIQFTSMVLIPFNWISNALVTIRTNFNTFIQTLKNLWNAGWIWMDNLLTQIFGEKWTQLKEGFGGVVENIKGKFDGMKTFFTNLINNIVTIWNNGWKLATNPLDNIGKVLSGVFGGKMPSLNFGLTGVKSYANGGVVPAVPGGAIVRVGEGGRNEAIVDEGLINKRLRKIEEEERASRLSAKEGYINVENIILQVREGEDPQEAGRRLRKGLNDRSLLAG